MRLILQLINGISKVLKKLVKYFNDIAVLTVFVLLSTGVSPVILILDLSNSDCVILSFGPSLKFYLKLPDVFA